MSTTTQLIEEFSKRSGAAAFPNLNRSQVVNQLRQRVINPFLINQGVTSLCGPACFLYSVAHKSADVYVKYIIDLYEKGEAAIGKLKAKPEAIAENTGFRSTPSRKLTGLGWLVFETP